MSERYVISDTHFGHTNAVEKFKRADGSPLRDFESVEACDEFMIEQWNKKVHPKSTVYHLGDVVINAKHLHLVKQLNGRKILIRGNHDIFRDDDYREVGFEQIHGVRVFVDKFILSHIPLHPDCVSGRFRVNVHGHLHANQIMRNVTKYTASNGVPFTMDEPDPRYLCVCVEQTEFTPLHFDEVESIIQKRWQDAGYAPAASDGWGNGQGPG